MTILARNRLRIAVQRTAAVLLVTVAAPVIASGSERDPQELADRAARDAERAEERATRDAGEIAERTAEIEQRFAEERAEAGAEALRDPEGAAEDLADAEADRLRDLAELADTGTDNSGSGSSGSGSGDSDNSGSGSSGSGSSGSGSGDSSDDNSGSSSNSGSGSDSHDSNGSSSSMRELANEERPEFDPRGFPVRHGEVVALDLDEAGLARAQTAGFRIVSRERLDVLSGTVTRLETPRETSPEAALAMLRSFDRRATFDYIHYYGLQLASRSLAGTRSKEALPHRKGNLTIGMIDTAVASHPELVSTAVTQRRFGTSSASGAQVQHGTAVASILSSQGSRRLLVADVFRGTPASPFTSADAIALSLEWMAESGVGVVNISLAGPRNAILDRLIERASARGMIIVAAAGNGGPTAPPAYPAALGPVVAVTAVDARSRVYRYANHGNYITVAAQGVAVPAASATGGIANFSGTSFATPQIAAWIARCLAGRRATPALCRDRLRLAARDAGAPGRDPVYGWGIVDAN